MNVVDTKWWGHTVEPWHAQCTREMTAQFVLLHYL
jgi:hypothetical protein